MVVTQYKMTQDNIEENIPMQKHPTTLAKSVPIGKEPAIGSL